MAHLRRCMQDVSLIPSGNRENPLRE